MASTLGSTAEEAEGSPPAGELVGRVVSGRYRVQKLLGEGGMGGVYLAEHTHMRKLVALKVLHPEMTQVPEVVARFEREAVAAANIDHPHVAAATDFGTTEDGAFYLVLEYVDGRSLRVEIAKGRMSTGRALHVARQIALALHRAHELGFVHRDLKPDNVMLVERGGDPDFVKVLDFGIAKVPLEQMGPKRPGATNAPLTRVGSVFGTPEYMAPEQALGQDVDARADLYALGVILYEMLAGGPPFIAESLTALLTKQLTEPPVPLSSRLPGHPLPPGVEALVMGLLQKEASQRPPSAAAVAEAIEAAAFQAGIVLGATDRRSMLGSIPGFNSAAMSAFGSAVTAMPGSGAWPSTDVLAKTNYPVGGGPPSPPRKTSISLRVDPHALASEFATTVRRLPKAARLAALAGAVGIVALFFLGTILVLRPPRSHDASAATSSRAGDAVPPSAPTLPWTTPKASSDELSRASAAGRGALEQLAYTYAEDASVARALLHAYRVEKQTTLLVKQVDRLLKLDGSAKDDPEVLEALVLAAQSNTESADAAIALLEGGLGPKGIDALYDLSVTTKSRELRAKYARSLEKPEVREQASKATVFLMDFRQAKGCEGKKLLLPRARSDGDARALALIKQLADPKGCGFLSLSDCYPCLRSRETYKQLKETIAVLEEKKASK